MKIQGLNHFNLIGTRELMDEVKQFYGELFGLTEGVRPDLPSDGAWLYLNDFPILHLSVVNDYATRRDMTGNLHHIAFTAEGYEEFKGLLEKKGIDYETFELASMSIRQIFFKDPTGLVLELNFSAQ